MAHSGAGAPSPSAALRVKSDTVISFNKLKIRVGGATDIDILLNGKAIELKGTLNTVTDQDIITKFFKYRATVGAGTPLELRSLDDVSTMQAFVEGAFEKYIHMKRADWPRWLQRLSPKEEPLGEVKIAISGSQAASTRYNYFAAAE